VRGTPLDMDHTIGCLSRSYTYTGMKRIIWGSLSEMLSVEFLARLQDDASYDSRHIIVLRRGQFCTIFFLVVL